jgi:hypothetical protein
MSDAVMVKPRRVADIYQISFRKDLAPAETLAAFTLEIRDSAGNNVRTQFHTDTPPAPVIAADQETGEAAKAVNFWLRKAATDEEQVEEAYDVYLEADTSTGRHLEARSENANRPIIRVYA